MGITKLPFGFNSTCGDVFVCLCLSLYAGLESAWEELKFCIWMNLHGLVFSVVSAQFQSSRLSRSSSQSILLYVGLGCGGMAWWRSRGGQDLPARLRRPVSRLWEGRAGVPVRRGGGSHGPRHAALALRAGAPLRHQGKFQPRRVQAESGRVSDCESRCLHKLLKCRPYMKQVKSWFRVDFHGSI